MVKERVVDLSCLLNFLRVSLLGFSTFCLILSMIFSTLSEGVYFLFRWCILSMQFVGLVRDDTVFGGGVAQKCYGHIDI